MWTHIDYRSRGGIEISEAVSIPLRMQLVFYSAFPWDRVSTTLVPPTPLIFSSPEYYGIQTAHMHRTYPAVKNGS